MPATLTQSFRKAAFEVRLVRTPADREAIARLRYDVYVEEMGRRQAYADHDTRTIHEPLDDQSFVVGAFRPDGDAIGTLRITPSNAEGIAFREIYNWEERELVFPGQVCLGSKLIVAREHRGTLVSVEVMRLAVHEIFARGWRFCFLDANDHLLPLYTRLGFVARARREHPIYGSVTIMEWDMHDADHARAVRSPFVRDVVARVNGHASAA